MFGKQIVANLGKKCYFDLQFRMLFKDTTTPSAHRLLTQTYLSHPFNFFPYQFCTNYEFIISSCECKKVVNDIFAKIIFSLLLKMQLKTYIFSFTPGPRSQNKICLINKTTTSTQWTHYSSHKHYLQKQKRNLGLLIIYSYQTENILVTVRLCNKTQQQHFYSQF